MWYSSVVPERGLPMMNTGRALLLELRVDMTQTPAGRARDKISKSSKSLQDFVRPRRWRSYSLESPPKTRQRPWLNYTQAVLRHDDCSITVYRLQPWRTAHLW